MGARCSCFTQDGTSYTTTLSICQQIVKNGLWLDFKPEGQSGTGAAPAHSVRPAGAVAGPVASAQVAQPSVQAPGYALIDGPGRQPAATTLGGAVAQTNVQSRVPPSSPWSFRTGGG